MNNFNDDMITEDSPVMRSAALLMQPASSPSFLRRSASPVNKAAPFSLEKALRVPSTTPQWRVQTTLEPLPSMYLVDRTHTHVPADAQTVANRIMDCLKLESIAVIVHEFESMIECETKERVQFSVRLFFDNEQTLVEVQRLSGCSYIFQQAARAILKNAKGLKPRRTSLAFTIPGCIPKLDNGKKDIEEALEIASSHLKSKSLDTQVMALESLVHVSQVPENRTFAAHAILSGEFVEELVKTIETSPAKVMQTDIEKMHMSALHRQALTAMANALCTLEQSGELLQVVDQQKSLRSFTLRAALLNEVRNANTRPHEACQAMRCLQRLASKQQMIELGARSAVQSAQEFGSLRHAELYQEASKLSALLVQ